MARVEIAPSILASDFLELGAAIRSVQEAGAPRLQVDVMDGAFVPNISVGQPVVTAVRRATDLLIETHLMIERPERYVADFAAAGADLIIVHLEATTQLYRVLQHIRELGKKAGVALNPATPAVALDEVYDLADLILVMTVSPGFGGQDFIAPMLDKVRQVRTAIDRRGLPIELEVDGGIDDQTAPEVVDAGARVLVAGTAIYGSPDISEAVRRLDRIANRALSRKM